MTKNVAIAVGQHGSNALIRLYDTGAVHQEVPLSVLRVPTSSDIDRLRQLDRSSAYRTTRAMSDIYDELDAEDDAGD